MDDSFVQEPQGKSPSTLRVVLWVGLVCALFLQSVLMLSEGEWYVALCLPVWELLALAALRVLRRRRGALFGRGLPARILFSALGLSGALGMFIQSINLGMLATFVGEAVWWAVPLGTLCFVLTFFLPAVVVLIWLPRREA